MTLNEIIYDTKEMFSVYSDDIQVSDEWIAFKFQNKRNTYLKNYLSNLQKSIPLQAKMQICLSLQEDDLCEDDFKLLKSTQKLPATLEASGRTNISEVYLNSRVAKWLNIVDYQRLPYLKSGRYNSKQIYITIDPEDYIIVYSPSGNHELLEEIKLNIVPENPEEAFKMMCSIDSECDFYDYKNYPIPAELVDPIQREIINELLVKYRIPIDVVNNAEDDTTNKNKLDGRNARRTKIE